MEEMATMTTLYEEGVLTKDHSDYKDCVGVRLRKWESESGSFIDYLLDTFVKQGGSVLIRRTDILSGHPGTRREKDAYWIRYAIEDYDASVAAHLNKDAEHFNCWH